MKANGTRTPEEQERARVAEWLHAKANETEELLELAAERGEPDARGAQLWFAKKTRILLYVLATMIEQDKLVLRDKPPEAA